jgi:hypothetical protein
VTDVHELVSQIVPPRLIVGLRSTNPPKFKPEIVTVLPVVVGVFPGKFHEIAGASNVNKWCDVPMCVVTVIVAALEPTPAEVMQLIAVPVTHVVV